MLTIYTRLAGAAASVLLLASSLPALAQAPAFISISPAANARSVARNASVVVTFSQPLTAGSAAGLRVFSRQRGGLRGGGAATVTGSTLTFAPTAYDFRPGETVQYSLTRAVAGAGGPLAAPRVGQFTAAVGGTGRGGLVAPAAGAELTAGLQPRGVAAGDIDNDGDLDLLVANASAADVSIRLNNGQGSFAAPATNAEVNMAGSPLALALGDVDGDGDLDLLTANGSSTEVALRLNNGAGGFGYPAAGAQTRVLGAPASIVLGDVDGDGDLDFVTAAVDYRSVSVRLNNGSGLFAAPALYADPTVGSNPASLALGDLDGDGDLDLAVANTGSLVGTVGTTVSLLLNDGAGHYTPPAANATVAVGSLPYEVVLGDVNGDGSLDLLTANAYSGTVSVRLNNGAGVFRVPAANPNPLITYSPTNLTLGDVDSDGDLDFVVANDISTTQGGLAVVRLNDGTGNFTTPTAPDARLGVAPYRALLADLDGDGDLDLASANRGPYLAPTATVSIRLNGGTGPLAAAAPAPAAALAAYPNPATGRATLALPPAATHAELLDGLGRVVRTVPARAGTATLEVAGLAPGLYLVRAAGQVAPLVVE